MKLKYILILLVSIPAFYITGSWLSSIYGFDPPYILYFTGYAFVLISFLLTFVLVGVAGTYILKAILNGKRPKDSWRN